MNEKEYYQSCSLVNSLGEVLVPTSHVPWKNLGGEVGKARLRVLVSEPWEERDHLRAEVRRSGEIQGLLLSAREVASGGWTGDGSDAPSWYFKNAQRSSHHHVDISGRLVRLVNFSGFFLLENPEEIGLNLETLPRSGFVRRRWGGLDKVVWD